ncbi:hypothetical protein L1785_07150 [Antribacter sp. KLBMP9083]|uniref:PH domain-containing protein n=1 Tax=Antribacter soli TaxID=2910976 RepID=A0AA41U6S5_9MICO|nr:hypothetical protein [Antribacter soli]MCF4120751.1 hypothetical protein [Antribacter soli]
MNLPLPLAVGIWVVLGLALLLLVLTGRRRLAQRTRAVVPVPPAAPAPEALGALRAGPVEAVYVSSTLAGDWLARVGAHGLGDRAAARVTVHDAGVLVEREGADDVFAPVATLRGAGLAPGMAGKYVGADGLVVITWEVPAADGVEAALLDTGLRTRRATDRGTLVDAVRHLVAAQTLYPPASTTPSSPPTATPTPQDAR